MASTLMRTKMTYARFPKLQQILLPNHKTANFVADDTDNHDYIVDCRGKSKASVCFHNLADETATITIYGAHASDADIGDTGVFEIDGAGNGSWTVLTTVAGYEVLYDPFPWIIIRCTYGSTPDGTTVYLYVDLQGG